MAMVEAAFVAAVLLMMLSLLFVGWKTPEIVVFLALVLVWNAGIVSTEDALSGFNNTGVLAVGSLFVVIKGVERSRLAERAAKEVFGLRTSFTAGLLRLMGLAFVLSAFLNNTPVVALLIPVTKDWALTRGFSPSLLLMPLSFACIFGGLVTIIGTSTNLVVQGLVKEASLEDPAIQELGFFEPGYIGLPLGLVGMLYLVIAAPRVLSPRASGDGSGSDGGGGAPEHVRDRTEELQTEVQLTHPFEHIGQPIALVLARLGLPIETLVKIRRRTLPPGAVGRVAPEEACLSVGGVLCVAHSGGALDEAAAAVKRRTPCLTGRTPNSGQSSRRKRLAVGWESKVDGSPPSATACADAATEAPAVKQGSRVSPSIAHLSDSTDYSSGSRRLGQTAETFSVPSTPERGRAADRSLPSDASPGLNARAPGDVAYGDTDVYPLSPSETVRDGDVVVLACPRSAMASFQGSVLSGSVAGLKVLGASVTQLSAQGTSFVELVLSDRNLFMGRCPCPRVEAPLPPRYGCRIVAVRHVPAAEPSFPAVPAAAAAAGLAGVGNEDKSPAGEGGAPASRPKLGYRYSDAGLLGGADEGADKPLRGEDKMPGLSSVGQEPTDAEDWGHAREVEVEVEAARRPLAPGDVVMVLTNEGFVKKWKDSPDFDLVTRVGSVPPVIRLYDYLSLLVFCGMLMWVLLSGVAMVRAAFLACGVLIAGGWVDPLKSVGYVDWALLLLVGSALGLSKAISNSGLAGYAGDAIRESGMSASVSLYVLYGFTMACTELITNNAAAALAVPIALSIAKELEVSYKPFVLTVMMAASSSFITPIGYQTNTMVWAPGNYKFSDFIRLGTPLSLIFLAFGSFLMPLVFPF